MENVRLLSPLYVPRCLAGHRIKKSIISMLEEVPQDVNFVSLRISTPGQIPPNYVGQSRFFGTIGIEQLYSHTALARAAGVIAEIAATKNWYFYMPISGNDVRDFTQNAFRPGSAPSDEVGAAFKEFYENLSAIYSEEQSDPAWLEGARYRKAMRLSYQARPDTFIFGTRVFGRIKEEFATENKLVA